MQTSRHLLHPEAEEINTAISENIAREIAATQLAVPEGFHRSS